MSEPESASTDDGTERAATETGDRAVSLELEGVTKEFIEDDGSVVVAVDDIDLTIYDGEFIVLVGPSGCGKTTTLRMIAGLETPTSGEIRIEGQDVLGKEPRERNIAMVFQNYALYPHKTVHENIAFPLEVRKYPDDIVQERVQEVAELLDIPELLDRQPQDLSGGQQQRVALGRAIVRDPSVFLFDEPLSNLDAKLRIQMRTELNKLHERVGKTSVYVTHDQAEAMTLSDRVAVMNDGELQQLDPPQTVYERPANRFVAGFIGEPPMNFFDAALEHRDGERTVVGDGFDIPLTPEQTEKLSGVDDGPITYGIRPEEFQDADLVDDPNPDWTFPAEIRVVEPMGAYIDLTLVPANADEPTEFTARVDNDSDASEGDILTLAVDVPTSHVFDVDSGENYTR